MKKNPFTTSNQARNTLEEVGISLSKSTIKRCFHEGKYKGFIARCKPLVTLKNRKDRKHVKKKIIIKLSDQLVACSGEYVEYGEDREGLIIQSIPYLLSYMVVAVLWHEHVWLLIETVF